MPNAPSPEILQLQTVVDARYAEVAEYVRQHTEGFVVDGPFAGMRLTDAVSWSDNDVVAKSLGCYEAELHRPLAALLARAPDVVVNVGCAEGYYAVGLARRLPEARVLAFDIAPEAQGVCALAARLNAVAARVDIGGRCSADRFAEIVSVAERPLALIDCEGDELALIAERNLPALARCDLIVECHDFIVPEISSTLFARLAPSHDLEIVGEAARNPNGLPFMRSLCSFDRWLAVCEFRPEAMNWLIATARR